MTHIIDIETAPLPESELTELLPKFDPSEVKVGNLKDPEKINAKIAEAEAATRKDFFENAALDPLTGRVLAIGLMSEAGSFSTIADDDEAALLRRFWNFCQLNAGRRRLIGFNIFLFDLPFLMRRSYKYRVDVPFNLRRGRYWSENLVDLREAWQLGDRQARGSLDTIAQFLGVGRMNGTGAQFAGLWQTDRPAAMCYLQNDLRLTLEVAKALHVVSPGVSLCDPVGAEIPGLN
ncbi:MAG TPA: ribonuclease H-like domain-containing protein [Verrucomicrobiae bacterium]|nr:ribonuclease H-like domain-containing protein [Verrucomicrobiae bacterium]